MSDEPLVEVRIVELPVALHRRAAAHQDALQREFDLIRAAGSAESDEVPYRLKSLIDELDQRFSGVTDRPRAELEAAIDRGADTVDLIYHVPRDAAQAARRLGQLLDEADAFCRRGEHLLTLATPPESLAYRQWFLREFIDQIERGAAPLPWSKFEAPEAPVQDASPRRAQSNEAHLPADWQLSRRESTAVLTMTGDLDVTTAPALREALQHLRESGPDKVTLDASAVDFIDSVGISVLIAAHKRFAEDGLPYELAVAPRVRRSLAIAGLEGILVLVDPV